MRSLPLVLLLAVAAACDDTPTTPSQTPTTVTITFASRVARNGFAWRSFTTKSAGTVTVQLSAMFPQTDAVVSLGLGTFSDSTCTITTSLETAPNSTDPQINQTLPAGSYCVRVADIGNLSGNTDFLVSIVTPYS